MVLEERGQKKSSKILEKYYGTAAICRFPVI
jgi:hypothetical protein